MSAFAFQYCAVCGGPLTIAMSGTEPAWIALTIFW